MGRFLHGGISDQKRAAIRASKDSQVLHENKRWSGAMYLAGYEIECGLKVKLMERYGCLNLDDLEAKLERIFEAEIDLKTHSIEALFHFFGEREKSRLLANPKLKTAYFQCTGWAVHWRYAGLAADQEQCEEFLRSVETFRNYMTNSL